MEQRITAQGRLQKKKDLTLASHRLARNWLCSLRPYIFIVLTALFPFSHGAEAMMITSNVIQRTFHIAWGKSAGTAFAIDHASKQYLVTARHVVKGIKSDDVIKIHHEGKWKDLPVKVVGIGKGEIDVTVLACAEQLAPPFMLIPSDRGLQFGHSVAFLGFPFAWRGGGEQFNRGFPLPLVKAGIISRMSFGDMPTFYLDGHGNQGFSGGPVVFFPGEQPGNPLHVAGVVSHYPHAPKLPPESPPYWPPLVNREGKPVTDSTGEPIGYIRENPGIVAAIPIRYVVELIDANPIGFPLPTGKDSQ